MDGPVCDIRTYIFLELHYAGMLQKFSATFLQWKYPFRPSVNRSCDYEIGFHDSQQSYLKWE